MSPVEGPDGTQSALSTQHAGLDAVAEQVRASFDAKNKAREGALALSREVIRSSANSIRATHRREYDRARELLSAGGEALARAVAALTAHPEILHAGFVHDAQKEYVEANATLALVRGEALPTPGELGVGFAAYLNGIGETVGELRRFLLDGLRRGDLSESERLLGVMDEIYGVLVTLDYPDAITGGLRRTTDMVRGVLEKTRGDLTIVMRQRDLEAQLRAFEARLREPTEDGGRTTER